MPVTLSDGTTTLDISAALEEKLRSQRLARIEIPGRTGDILQSLATKQLEFKFKWTLQIPTAPDPRPTFESWQVNATSLTLIDLEYAAKTVILASWKITETPGIPNLVVVELTLLEKI